MVLGIEPIRPAEIRNALPDDDFRTLEGIIETPDSVPVLNRAPEFVTTE